MTDSLIYDLCKAVGNQLLKKVCLLHDVPEEAKKMEQNLVNITAVLKAAEQREIEADVKIWLSDLKTVAYDIEDVLDDWMIAELKMADEAGTSHQGTNFKAKVPSPVISSPYIWTKQLKSHFRVAQRIKSINERLGEIVERKNRFNFPTSNIRINEGPKLQATSAYGDYTVVPRQEEVKAKVIQMLVHGDSKGNVANGNHIPTISLVGMGGIGKTTLARLVYNDDSVKGHFSKTIWVCVSKPFNEMNVAKAIAEGLNLDVRNDSAKQNVLSKIDGSIWGLKFLLVLDDVWEDSEGKWSDILGCLGKGAKKGSRILMTTRSWEFPKKMGAGIVSVDALCAEDARLLFSYYAFIGDSDHREEVKDIAEKLAKECHGLPLALEVLGRHMAAKTTRTEWDDVLRSELWKKEFENKVFNSLAVSYLELPSAAKRCFAFCSIFPKDTDMTKSNLIRLWMAEGYLEEGKPNEMEVLGEKYFESLERRSFFRVFRLHGLPFSRKGVFRGEPEFALMEVTMHDIVHDFARYISNGEVAILDPSLDIHAGGDISKKLCHLAISGKTSKSICPHSTFEFNALRTLFFSTDSAAVLKAVCSNKSYIRALDIKIDLFPMKLVDYHFKDIGKLVHLRYLRFRTYDRTALPKEICGLPFLQTLDILGSVTGTLPNEIGRLTSLRHLLFNTWVCSLPKGLRKLSSLQTLKYFSCSALDNDGCSSIEDLRDLNNLRGELQLKKLNNVTNVDEATRAELRKKTQIRKLCLEFGDGDASLQSEVLEALQPAERSIEILEIRQHRGRRYPRWIGKMQNLKEVLLYFVSMEFLPEMGMLRFLKKLTIWGAYEVKHVGAKFYGMFKRDVVFFPKLEYLKFDCMRRWEHWEGPNVITRSGVPVTIMPSLRWLIVVRCDVLQTLPHFLEHVPLEWLDLCGESLPLIEPAEIDYPNRWQIGDILLPQTLKRIQTPSLALGIPKSEIEVPGPFLDITRQTTLVPRYIMDLTYLRVIYLKEIEDESLPPFGLLPSLLELSIRDAHNVGKVGDEFLGISSNNTTAAFVVVFPRLEKLTFGNMEAWREWEDPVHGGNINLAIMPSLCYLKIVLCEKLKSLPHLFDSVPLRTLDVAADEKGDMVRIRNSSRMDEATACKTIIASAATLPQPELREITLSGVKNDWVLDWAKYCKGLIKLTLSHDCGVASLAALELLPSLEFLEISFGKGIRHIGKELLQLSSLLYLYIILMDDLEEWEDPPPQLEISDESIELSRRGNNNGSSKINFMPSLSRLFIFGCPNLKALPSFLRSVPLEELQIVDCPGLTTWWINEAGDDWYNWKSNIPRFKFPDSETDDESP